MMSDELPPCTLAELEKTHCLLTLRKADGNVSKAARWLGVGRSTLNRKLLGWGLREPMPSEIEEWQRKRERRAAE